MKIGLIIHTLDIPGGTQRQIIMLARELVKRGHEVKLFTFIYLPKISFPELTGGLSIIALDQKYSPFLARFFRLRFIGTFVHQWFESRRCRELALRMDPDFDILSPHDQMSMRVAYFYKKLIRDIPSAGLISDLFLANWSYADDPALRPPHRTFLQRLINWFRDEHLIDKYLAAQEVIAVLNDRTAHIAGAFLHRWIKVVRPGVDIDDFPYIERQPIDKTKKIKLFSHNFFYIHRRYEDTLEAVAMLRDRGYDVDLTIVGNHSFKDTARAYYERLQGLVRKLHLEDRVTFRGEVSAEDLLKEHHKAQIFVNANHLQTWGIAPFEALSTGLPIVISNTIGASEVLTHGENALIFEALYPEEIAANIERLINEPDLYMRISKRGSEFARTKITWQRWADDFLRFFAEAKEIHDKKK